MGKLNRLLGLMVLLFFPAMAIAADEPGRGADGIAPYVDGQTIMVIQVDVGAIDASALQAGTEGSEKQANAPEDQKGHLLKGWLQAKARIGKWAADFKRAGGKTVYLMLNMDDLRNGLEIAVPLTDGMDVPAIKSLLLFGINNSMGYGQSDDSMFATRGKFLLFGNRRVVQAMQSRQPVDRPELDEAMKAAGDSPIRGALILSQDIRKALVDMMPQLPEELGGGSTEDLLGSISYGWVSLSLAPAQALRLEIRYQDADSASRAAAGVANIHGALEKLLKNPASQPADVRAILTTLLPALTPGVDGDKLVLDWSGSKSNVLIDAVMDSIVTSIVRNRAIVSRTQSASNLRQIGQAILLYTEDSKGPYPPNLGTLVKTEDISARVFLNPATGNKLPDNWEKMSKDEQFKWVSDDSDYVFAGAGLSQGADPAIVIAYEKQGETTEDGINVLYADGHVEFDTPEQLKSSLEQSKKIRSQSK